MAPRICVVGAGTWFTRAHLPALKSVCEAGRVECAAVCDRDPEKARAGAAELDAAAFADVDRMVAEVRPDGLVFVVGCSAMTAMVRLAAERRLPFLCEKPPATDLAAHRRLIETVGDLPHIVGYNRRHAPYVTTAKEWLAGERLQVVTVHFSRHRRREKDFTDTAVHAIDTALFFSGPLAAARIETAPTGHVHNFFINGWTDDGVHVNIMVMPDTGSAQEHYICRSTDKTVRVAFPQCPMIDRPGYVELHEGNRVVERRSHGDFGIAADDMPALVGVRGEHELFARLLSGEAEPVSTIQTSLYTQELRELLADRRAERVVLDWRREA